ncbi:uncharacterized protein LOC143247342 isoform X1 [Tachypleus tridentatus]|uniref:uncharacterized protein LOC143247342 isoform X1 n=1 Tax=Tachypleus tridentatus TaxID=6853 RepID=UPI003FD37847
MWVQRGLILLACLQTTWTQINELTPVAMMPQITSLKVQCEKTGMIVSVEFDRPFNGIIYSKGYYSSPGCRYIEVDSGLSEYTFFIPKEDCGTVTFPDPNDPRGVLNFENIIIFQMDPIFQEAWDLARKLSCQWVDIFRKHIEFQPFVVDMLNIVTVPFQGDKIECWMELQIGTFPETQPIDGIVKIGQRMSIIIYIGSSTDDVDVRVRDCYAFDRQNYNSSDTQNIQLTDLEGCPAQPKLINYWKRTLQTGDTGASIIAFTSLNAFKFPEGMNVYITCNIDVCKQHCEDRCPGEPTNPVPIIVTPPTSPTTRPPITTPPITHPPITRPPIIHPPITTPPITRPPITRPPITYPSITKPSVTRPPITRPPITHPPITRPPITRPPITRPPITRPPITRPPITRPPITRPPITRPPITRPPITGPPIIHPPITKPPTQMSWKGNAPPDHPFHDFHYQPILPRRFPRHVNSTVNILRQKTLNIQKMYSISLRTKSYRLVKENFLDSSVEKQQHPK